MDFSARFRAAFGRVAVAATGVGIVSIVALRLPVWWVEWKITAVLAVTVCAAIIAAAALWAATRGSVRLVRRASFELAALACALLVADVSLLWSSPELWSTNPRVQQEIIQAERARARGLPYDDRVRAEVVKDLRQLGLPAMPGYSADMTAHPAVAAAAHERGLLPLANASRAYIVECNEGAGYLQFRTDELGFNNPPGLALGPAKIAVFGESLALGHCVPPGASVVDLVRAHYPRTANFGVPGARVLSQLGVYREYIEPLQPELVVWFVNVSYAEAAHEGEVPILAQYLEPSFSQDLRQRQPEVDSFVREVLAPLHIREEEGLRAALTDARRFPLERVFALRELRGLIDLSPRWRPEPSDLRYFQHALESVVRTSEAWEGKLLVVVLPGFRISTRQPQSVARYEAVRGALSRAGVGFVDGPQAFAAVPDVQSLYALGLDNHPNERGHALLADALISAIKKEGLR